MKNAKTRRGSILMETVIVLPIIMLIFTFIWEFTLQARDQLFVAELGLSAVRLLAQHTSSAANREAFPDDTDGKYKDHRTSSYTVQPVQLVDGNAVADLGARSALQIRDWVQNDANAPWTMLVGARVWYKGSDAPEKRPLWMDLGSPTYTDDRPDRFKPKVRATVARVMTYSLARTSMSYEADYPRHRTPDKLAGSPSQWYSTARNNPYAHLPDVDTGAVRQRTWVSVASADPDGRVRNDLSGGAWSRSTMDGYTRRKDLDFIADAQP